MVWKIFERCLTCKDRGRTQFCQKLHPDDGKGEDVEMSKLRNQVYVIR